MNQLDTMPTGPGTSFEKDSGITLAFLAIAFSMVVFFCEEKIRSRTCLPGFAMHAGWLVALHLFGQ
jgi:hypothetical protein